MIQQKASLMLQRSTSMNADLGVVQAVEAVCVNLFDITNQLQLGAHTLSKLRQVLIGV